LPITNDQRRDGHEEFFFWPEEPEDGRLVIGGAEAKHISRVMRHKPGDRVAVTDGAGNEHQVELTDVSPSTVSGKVLSTAQRPREPRHRVVLAQAILKGDKLATVVEQAAELGVSEIVPLLTARTIGRLTAAREQRLRKVALSGMKSSTGAVLLKLEPAMDLGRLSERIRACDQTLVAYEDERHATLAETLRPRVDSVMIVIGPEGGFEPEEIALLRTAGAAVFGMGPRRLRAETASLVATAAAMQLLGDLSDKRDKLTNSKGGVIGSW